MTALSVGDGRPMPQDGAIQIALNRYLLPASVSRASVQLRQANGEQVTGAQAPNVVYDPVARTVTLTRPLPGKWLEPGQPYRIRLPSAQDAADTVGLRAIDGTPLAKGQPLEYVFFVDPTPRPASRSLPDTLGEPDHVSFCADVLPIFARKCGTASCHGSKSGGNAAAGLVLDRADGIRATAINRVAHGATVGGASNRTTSEGPIFGVDMPIISVDPSTSVGQPGNSWLVYKIELAPPPVVDVGEAGAPEPFACTVPDPLAQAAPFTGLLPLGPADDLQRTLLGDFVLGREMPYPPPVGAQARYEYQPLTFQERETVRMWIARGAATPDCGVCGFVEDGRIVPR